MKRIHTTMLVGLMAAVVIVAVGCKREYGTVTLGANIDNGRDAKVYIDNLTPCWHNNDQVRINSRTYRTSAALGSSAQITDVLESNHYRAIYPSNIFRYEYGVSDDLSNSSSVNVSLPLTQWYSVDDHGDQKVNVPMGAYSSSETLTFHNLCSLIKVVISNRTNEDFVLDRIVVTTRNAYLSGEGYATVEGQTSDRVDMIPSSASHQVSLDFSPANRPTIGRGDRDTYVYYIIAPEFNEDDVIITLCSQGRYATFEKRASLQHNKIAQVSLTVDELAYPPYPPSVDGALPGLFSVSATRQVRFSQGNLQYQASTNTWRFAEHQYDYVGSELYGNVFENGIKCNNNNISSTYNGWIDLFGFGTSGWNSGAVCYQPWSTSTSYSDYCPGSSSNNDLTGAYAEADWAWHNAISNGGNAVHQWRTLTESEWHYLINNLPSGHIGIGCINGVGGLILLPNSWTLPSGCSFTSGVSGSSRLVENWSRNIYTTAQWAQMEAAGAVFLPAAGYRDGTVNCNIGREGDYRSSSTDNGYSVSGLLFHNWTTLTFYVSRKDGCSIRPVRDN